MDNKVMDKFVVEMLNLLQSAKDFTMAQAPEVAKEVLRYEIASDTVYIAASLGLFIFSFYSHKKIQACMKKDAHSEAELLYIIIVPTIGASPWAAFICIIDIIKATLAPRLYLIEYLSHLIRHS